MNYVEWIRNVDANQPGRFLLCTVTEPFLWEGMKQVLQSDVLGGERLSFNYVCLNGRALTAEEFTAAVETLPLFAPRRVVVVEHTPLDKEDVTKQGALLQAIVDCVVSLPQHVLLVLEYDGEKPFAGKLYKQMQPELERVEILRLNALALSRFIEKRLRSMGVRADSRAIALLGELSEYLEPKAGKTLYDVANLTDRVAALADQGVLSSDQVREGSMTPQERNVFALMDAITLRQADRALHLYEGYLALGEDPVGLFYLVVRQVRLMIGVSRAARAGISPRDIQQRLNLKPFAYKKIRMVNDSYHPEELLNLFDLLFDMERRMKTVPFAMDEELRRFLLRLDHPVEPQRFHF